MGRVFERSSERARRAGQDASPARMIRERTREPDPAPAEGRPPSGARYHLRFGRSYLGNAGVHGFSADLATADVYHALSLLTPILDWYCKSERPDALDQGWES